VFTLRRLCSLCVRPSVLETVGVGSIFVERGFRFLGIIASGKGSGRAQTYFPEVRWERPGAKPVARGALVRSLTPLAPGATVSRE
jgi:hypothetical protein